MSCDKVIWIFDQLLLGERIDQTCDGARADEGKRHNPATIERLEASLANIAAQIAIGRDIAARHPGVSALGMQRLLDAFRNYKGDVENLLPAAVDSQDSYDRFVTIMRRINQYLFPAFILRITSLRRSLPRPDAIHWARKTAKNYMRPGSDLWRRFPIIRRSASTFPALTGVQ